MKSTRRLFLKETGLFAAATVLPVGAFSQEVRNAENTTFDAENLSNLDGVTAETFERWTGSRFRVSLDGRAMGSLVLATVDKKDASATPAQRSSRPGEWVGPSAGSNPGLPLVSFTLVFQRSGAPLPQETYLLSHDWLGRFPLLLVPSGKPGPASKSFAVFAALANKTPAS